MTMPHVLIVEDHEPERKLLKMRLERIGYRVTAAGNGVEALAAARRDPPDAIVSDALMPKMDGFALCRAWMQDAELKAIPFIFYSATYLRREDKQFGLALGAVRYLIKPLDAEVFLAELRAVLQPRAGRAAPAPASPLNDTAAHALHESALAHKIEDKIAQLEASNRKLQESEARYRQLFEANPHPMWVFDPETLAFLAVNDTAVAHYGWSREEFFAMTLADIRPAETMPALLQYLATDNEKRIRTVDSSKHRKKDGTLIDVEISSHIVDFGGRRARIASAYDITERKQAEAALARESHRNQVFLRNASDGVHILDADGKVLEVSDAFCQMLGYSREELIGANVSLWDAQWSPHELKQLIAEQIAKEGRSILETKHRRRDGSFLEVEVTGQGLELDGKPVLFNSARDITEHKRAEEALRNSEKDLQEAQRLANVGSWDWDIATDAINWSKEYYRIYRIDPTQRPPGYVDHLKAYTPESAALLDAAVRRSTQTGEPYELDLELACTEGPRRWITARSETKRDAQGKIIGLRGTVQEITERKRAEEDQRAAALYARSLIEASLDPLVTINPAGKITDVNKAAEEVTGVEREHLIGTDFADYFTEPDKARAGYKEVRAQGYVRDYPLTIRRNSGRTTDVLYNAVVYRNEAGELQGVFAAAHDITERKRAEEIRTQLAAIVQSSHDAIIGKDLDGVITSWNPGAEKIYGYQAEEVIGKPISILAPESSKHEITDLLENVRRAEAVINFETARIRKDGTCIDIFLDLSPIRDATGRLVGASTIARDITGKKQAERALHKVNRALKATSECNLALIHASGENQLLNDICRIIVDTGGFRLAWVGYVEHDAQKSVRPVAHSGYEPGYMEHTNITWANDELGSGPVGIAIRTGEIQVVPDVNTDPRFEPWRANAVKLGYGSVLVAPLVSGSETIGALSIHAVGANAFDAGEIALLGELAADMAFGIVTLRTRSMQEQSAKRLQRSMEESITAIAATVEMRDPYTGGHQRRVADLAVAIAHDLGLPEDRVHGIHLAAVVHDVGKIRVPAEILSKPGKLGGIEFELIKSHSQAGYDILKSVDFPWPIAQIVLQHHERMDGSGYPQGLKGEAILLEARIMAVADVIEAMSSHRPYRPGLGIDKALAEIDRGRGTLYDADVAGACLRLFHEKGYAIPA